MLKKISLSKSLISFKEKRSFASFNKCVKYTGGSFQLIEEPIIKPGPGQALIEIKYSTCNPHDRRAFQTYLYDGARLGCDGAGVIVEVGPKADKNLIGQKVSFFNEGWGKFKLQNIDELMILDHDQDLSKAANGIINPLTACGLAENITRKGAKAAVTMAGASALSQTMQKLCLKLGIDLIQIIRRDEQAIKMRLDCGAKYALNSTSSTFLDEFQELSNKLDPKVLFEFVGGDLPGKIFQRMPHESELVIVGNLTGEPLILDPVNILYQEKFVSSYLFFRWFKHLKHEDRQIYFEMVSKDLKEGGKIFGTKYAKRMKLQDWREAIDESAKIANDGKILIEID